MISTYKVRDDTGNESIKCEMFGSLLEIFNDFRAIFAVCKQDTDITDMLNHALHELVDDLNKDIETLKEACNDQDNSGN